MKRAVLLLLAVLSFSCLSAQNVLHAGEPDWADDATHIDYQMKASTASCGSPFISTGYPAWTNYWAGWMVNIINTNACPITITSFEARFQGTTGYRIYTKVGTFVGFQTTAGAWTLVGTLASLTGTSTTAPTAIPIVVNVTIPAGATQAFYLTRSDNVIANRHLYITGTGTPGTTIYASNADLSITEANYIDPYFAALQVGSRRPSFDACYTVNCMLPIELLSFTGSSESGYNLLKWSSATETNNNFYTVEKSPDGVEWDVLTTVSGAGNSSATLNYSVLDYNPTKIVNYYRLKQTDFNGHSEYFHIIAVDNTSDDPVRPMKIIDCMGREYENMDKPGFYIVYYENGTSKKMIIK